MTEVQNFSQELMSEIAVIKRDTAENTRILNEVLHRIVGNGKVGLTTQTELNKSAINRIWWWLGSVSAAILTLAIFIIRRAF